ncbi:MAG: glycosyltransferase family 39 protein [Elusimicrobia bacterium]|nr:glycosyltransferase family 39 protein [Elusimicrobiota bacterium]
MVNKNKKQKQPSYIESLRLPVWVIIIGLIFWFYIVAKNYYSIHPVAWPFRDISSLITIISDFVLVLIKDIIIILMFASVSVIAYRIGQQIIKWLNLQISGLEYIIFCIGTGLSIIIFLMFGLGVLGLLYRMPFQIGLVICLAISIWKIKLPSLKNDIPEKLDFGWWFLIGIITLFVLLNIGMVFMPEIFYDSLVYHLACPNFYLIHHKIMPMEFLMHSNIPSNMQMLYLLAITLKDEILAKMFHFGTGLFIMLLVYSTCKNIFSTKTGIISAAIFYSIPMVAMNSWTCGNDIGLSFFFTLAFCSFLNWLHKKNNGFLFLSAFFSGMTLGAKYTGIFPVIGLGIAVATVLFINEPFWKATKKIIIWGLVVFALVAPWLIKNYVFTGNPVQPFLYKTFGGQNMKIDGGGKGVATFPLKIFNFNVKEFILFPWRNTIEGNDSQSYMGALLLFMLPLLVLPKKVDSKIKYSLVCFIAAYVFWFLGAPVYRHLLASLVCLAIVVGWATTAVSAFIPFIKWIVSAVCITNLLALYSIAFSMTRFYKPFGGNETKDEFLSKTKPTYPNPPYSVILWLNKNIPADSKVLFVGESKSYYMQRDFISYSVETNLQPLMEFLKASKDANAFRTLLQEKRVTHFLINYREAVRVNSSYKTFYWTESERKIFDEFWKKYIKFEYFDEGVYLYSVLPVGSQNNPKEACLNILEELEKKNWANNSLLMVFTENKMWDSVIDEYETYLYYGYDVKKQLEYLYQLRGQKSTGVPGLRNENK